jgi:hypothetical protein
MELFSNLKKIFTVEDFYEKWKDCDGMRVGIENNIVKVRGDPLNMTKTIFLETNFPKNKTVEIKIIDNDCSASLSVKKVYICIIYSHGVIIFYCPHCPDSSKVKDIFLKNEIDKLYIQKKYIIDEDKIFDNLFFRGIKIENLSVIRKFHEHHPNKKFVLFEVDGNFNIDLNYLFTQSCVIFTDESDSDKFHVFIRQICLEGDKYVSTKARCSWQQNLIFRGNNKIEICYIGLSPETLPMKYYADDAELELIKQYRRIYTS